MDEEQSVVKMPQSSVQASRSSCFTSPWLATLMTPFSSLTLHSATTGWSQLDERQSGNVTIACKVPSGADRKHTAPVLLNTLFSGAEPQAVPANTAATRTASERVTTTMPRILAAPSP